MMQRRSRAFRPGDAHLEARTLLSAASGDPMALVSTLSVAPTNRQGLSGNLNGTYRATSQDNRPADAPLPIRLNTSGNLAGYGRMTLAGTLDFGGFRMANTPDITGNLTLSNHKGTLTIQVSGTGGNGPVAGQTFRLNASVVKGTGEYANVRSIGTLTLRLGGNTNRPNTPIAGNATVALSLTPPRR